MAGFMYGTLSPIFSPFGHIARLSAAVAYAFSIVLTLLVPFYELKIGVGRAAWTLPIRRKAIASALWVTAVLAPSGVLAIGAVAEMMQYRLLLSMELPPALLGEQIEVGARDLLLTPLITLILTSSVCLVAECLAEVLRRFRVAAAEKNSDVWAAAPAVLMLSALSLIAFVLCRVPVTWPMVDAAHAAAFAAGVVLVVLSFRYRQWAMVNVSKSTRLRIARKPVARKGARMPSCWWSAWRPHVVAACWILAIWAAFCAIPIAVAAAREEDAVSLSEFVSRIESLFLCNLCIITVLRLVSVTPLRAYRFTPMSSARLTLRIASVPALVCAALLLGLVPGVFRGDPHAVKAVMNVWSYFGMTLLMLAVCYDSGRSRKAAVMLFVCVVVLVLLPFGVHSSNGMALANVLLTGAGVCGVYAAITRSTNAYRPDFMTWGIQRR